jgi:hypothetical protein
VPLVGFVNKVDLTQELKNTARRSTMNRFQQHHRDAIQFGYSCFDRMILRGAIVPFNCSARAGTICWFLRTRRELQPSRAAFAKISRGYHEWVEDYAQQLHIDILKPERGSDREALVEPYFQQLGQRSGVAVILRAREPERVAWHYAKTGQVGVDRRHLDLYYFYLNDPQCGRMFLRVCPYFPCNIGVWLNGHNWLACQLRKENIAFEMRDNLFVACARPERLQQLSDAFAPSDVVSTVATWTDRLLPFFSDAERQEGYRHQLYMAQMEYCHNLIFNNRRALDRLFERLLDANRCLGHPDKLAAIFGRARFRPDTRTGQTAVKITPLRLPVISSSFKQTLIKQYAKGSSAPQGDAGLRTESSTFQLKDLALPKNINNLPKVREVLNNANERYLAVQQDVLASYVDRGQLEQLRQPSVSPSGRRVPGMHIDDPRLMAVLQAILCFAYLVGKGVFRTKDLLLDVQHALGNPQYTLNQLRYDLSKLRGKGMVARLAGSQSYQVSSEGYRLGIFHLKLYQQMYAPLTSAIRDPVAADNEVLASRQMKLDRLYVAVDQAVAKLAKHLGMAA